MRRFVCRAYNTTPMRVPTIVGEEILIFEKDWGAVHQLLNIILQLRIIVLLLLSTLPYVVKVKNYS
jgi:hypothetical protein